MIDGPLTGWRKRPDTAPRPIIVAEIFGLDSRGLEVTLLRREKAGSAQSNDAVIFGIQKICCGAFKLQ